jgi:outer membrane lipoprotein SlyB
MKKCFIFVILASVVFSSCDTYTGAGAYGGSTVGAVLGSAIGGIADGPRGSDIGTLVGMAGGAIVGGAIGNAKDKQIQRDMAEYRQDKAERAAARAQRNRMQDSDRIMQMDPDSSYDSGFDATNSGDDRLYDFNSTDYTGNYSAQEPEVNFPMESSVEQIAEGLKYSPAIEIRNARFVDDNQDGQIERGEVCKIIFEVINKGDQPLYDVQPTVIEATGNKHLVVSPNMHIESIMPGKGIRYTAMIMADNRLKAGSAKFCVSVIQGTHAISKVIEFNIPTRK